MPQGVNALRETPYGRQTTWNRIPDHIRQIVVELSLEHPELTPRELSVLLLEESQIFVSESSFYRILHERGLLERMEHDFVLAADEFHHKTKFSPMRCGRSILPISKSRVGAGIISLR